MMAVSAGQSSKRWKDLTQEKCGSTGEWGIYHGPNIKSCNPPPKKKQDNQSKQLVRRKRLKLIRAGSIFDVYRFQIFG